MKKVSRKEKIEMKVGQFVLMIIGAIIGVGLILGALALLGYYTEWIISSTLRFWVFIIVHLAIFARFMKKELELQ